MTTLLELANAFEAALLRQGLTRQELTEKAGVSRQAVYRLLKGHDVQLTTLLAVANILDLDLAAVPRSMVRGIPELQGAVRDLPLDLDGGEQKRVAGREMRELDHIPSAVQKRLAQRAGRAPNKKIGTSADENKR